VEFDNLSLKEEKRHRKTGDDKRGKMPRRVASIRRHPLNLKRGEEKYARSASDRVKGRTGILHVNRLR